MSSVASGSQEKDRTTSPDELRPHPVDSQSGTILPEVVAPSADNESSTTTHQPSTLKTVPGSNKPNRVPTSAASRGFRRVPRFHNKNEMREQLKEIRREARDHVVSPGGALQARAEDQVSDADSSFRSLDDFGGEGDSDEEFLAGFATTHARNDVVVVVDDLEDDASLDHDSSPKDSKQGIRSMGSHSPSILEGLDGKSQLQMPRACHGFL